MRFEVNEWRCQVSQSDGVFIGKVYEHDELVCTITADSLEELRSLFNEWIAGDKTVFT